MKKLLILIGAVLLLASCATYDCRHVAVDSYTRAVEQGQDARIVVGKMWQSGKPIGWIWDQPWHAEAQVFIDGEWCFVDNGTGWPLTGWYGHMVEPGMHVQYVYPTVAEFVRNQFDKGDVEYKKWVTLR